MHMRTRGDYDTLWQEFESLSPTSPYVKMKKELYKIILKHEMKFNTGFFEETILKIANIKETPQVSCFGHFVYSHDTEYAVYEEELIDVHYHSITEKSIKQLVHTLNEINPTLNAHTLPADERDPSIRSIRMNPEAVRLHILPLIAEYINNNSEVAAKYRKYTSQYVKYTSDELRIHLSEIFGRYYIKTMETACFEESIRCVVNRNKQTQFSVSTFFHSNSVYARDVADIAFAYLGNVQICNPDDTNADANSELSVSMKPFAKNTSDKFAVDLFVESKEKQHELDIIARYFNQLKPGSATVMRDSASTKIVVDNGVFFNEKFVIQLNDVLSHYSQKAIELYQKKSGTISATTEECLENLNNAKISLQSEKFAKYSVTKKLLEAIQDLITHMQQYRLQDQEQANVLDSLITMIDSKRRILKGVITPDKELFQYFNFHDMSLLKYTLASIKKLACKNYPLPDNQQVEYERQTKTVFIG